MALLRSGFDSVYLVRGDRVWLRPPVMRDFAAWCELRQISREHLRPWEPTWAGTELARGGYRRRVRHYARELRDDLGYAFLIFARSDDRLLGGLTLSSVRRGVTQAAVLGYWLGLPHINRGYMTDAVRAILPFAFNDLRLHRIEAACMPENTASMRVLERCHFVREGVARSYLKIDGVWRDHVLLSRLADDASVVPAASEVVAA